MQCLNIFSLRLEKQQWKNMIRRITFCLHELQRSQQLLISRGRYCIVIRIRPDYNAMLAIFPVFFHQHVAGPDVSEERPPGRPGLFPAAAEAETGQTGDYYEVLPQPRWHGHGEAGGEEEEKPPWGKKRLAVCRDPTRDERAVELLSIKHLGGQSLQFDLIKASDLDA